MTKKQEGFFWHVHHEVLLEWCLNHTERANYIRLSKPQSERATRLRLLRPVKGKLPKGVAETWEACYKAWQVFNEARGVAYTKAWKTYHETRKAYAEALIKNKAKIEKLHKKECPNCPWNGHTIFSIS